MINKIALITGSNGFIGFHLSKLLLKNDWFVIGYDGMTDYYDVNLKKDREKKLFNFNNFKSYHGMLEDKNKLFNLIKKYKPSVIIHLAAQAGVRYSILNPESYFNSNLLGTFHILEAIKIFKIKHLLLASTSSVYGSNNCLPFNENQKADTQMSFYAASKKAAEVLSHSYSHIYQIPVTIFRFFTVYGPWGRPDMALFKFTKAILEDKPIEIYNHGDMERDFTYVDDLTKSIMLLINKIPGEGLKNSSQILSDSISDVAPYRIVNIGNANPVKLTEFIKEIEYSLGKKAIKKHVGMQLGDVKKTSSDITLLNSLINFTPNTSIKTGVRKFVDWFKLYYGYSKK